MKIKVRGLQKEKDKKRVKTCLFIIDAETLIPFFAAFSKELYLLDYSRESFECQRKQTLQTLSALLCNEDTTKNKQMRREAVYIISIPSLLWRYRTNVSSFLLLRQRSVR